MTSSKRSQYWGPDYIAIYNEAYIALAGAKHPKLMGQSYKEAWAEIWDDVAEVFEDAKYKGQSTMKVRTQLPRPSHHIEPHIPYHRSSLHG